MPSTRGHAEPRWVVILEDIRSQNRATLEAVGASHMALAERIDRFEERTESRFGVVEVAIEWNSRGIAALEAALHRLDQESRSRDGSLELAVRELKVGVQQNSVDIRDLAGKVEAVSRLEERVSALERRGA